MESKELKEAILNLTKSVEKINFSDTKDRSIDYQDDNNQPQAIFGPGWIDILIGFLKLLIMILDTFRKKE